jgi:hypothetical protein
MLLRSASVDLGLAVKIGSGTLSGLTSIFGCPGEARCLSPSSRLPAARPDGPPPPPNILEQAAVGGQRKRDAAVAGPLRNLADVTASRDKDCNKAVPKAVEGVLGIPAWMTAGLQTRRLNRLRARGPPRGAVKTNASGSGSTKFARCSSSRRITDRATGTVRLEREVFGS